MSADYPLGHHASELTRLDQQAAILADGELERLAASATSVLEIGCAHGAHLPRLRAANPHLEYTGIDLAREAILVARHRFARDPRAHFHVADATSTGLRARSYDLVFSHLVLWSVGPAWTQVLAEAKRLLKPGGTFYALEPVNHRIELEPARPAARAWMQSWDRAAQDQGLDPFVGEKVAGALQSAGFRDVRAHLHAVTAPGSEPDAYRAVTRNLAGFFFGPAAERLGLDVTSAESARAEREMTMLPAGARVTDAVFVTTAYA